METPAASPAVYYARIFGLVFTIVGILGFFVTSSQDTVESLLGFDVNLTHNIVHLATGLLGLAAGFVALIWARAYALVFGVVYTVLGIWGLSVGDGFDPFGLLGSVNMADNILHLGVGVLGLGAVIASRAETRTTI